MKEKFDRTKPHRNIADLEMFKNKTPEERKLEIIRTKENIKGIHNKFIDANSEEDAENTIELNGANSKLIIIEK